MRERKEKMTAFTSVISFVPVSSHGISKNNTFCDLISEISLIYKTIENRKETKRNRVNERSRYQ